MENKYGWRQINTNRIKSKPCRYSQILLNPSGYYNYRQVEYRNQFPTDTGVFSISVLQYSLCTYNRVTMLTREVWTRGHRTPVVKGLIWFTVGSKMAGGARGWGLWTIRGKKVQYPCRAELYAILACVYEIESKGRPEE